MKRHFQIKNTDSRGHGSFYYFDVKEGTPDEGIRLKAEETITAEVEKIKGLERRYLSFIPHQRFHPTLKVVEITSRIEEYIVYDDDGKGWEERPYWYTKRGGLKFKLSEGYVRATFRDGRKVKASYYEAVA